MPEKKTVPKVSVLIPVYNGMPYIKEAVQSVLNQEWKDLELIFSDNMSTDGTWEYIQKLAEEYNFVRCYRNERNLGMVGNWNRALEYARGEYIKVLPADDRLLPGCLEKQVRILDQYPEVELVCGPKHVIDYKGRYLFTKRFFKKNRILDRKESVRKVIRSGSNNIGEGGCVMFRRRILEKAGGFEDDIFYVEDIQLWFKILLHGKLYVMSEPVAEFRISGISLSVQRSGEQLKGWWAFIDKFRKNKSYGITLWDAIIGKIKNFVLFFVKQLIYFLLRITGR